MVVRIILAMLLIVLAGGFIFFVGNVIWLGTKEFFKVYGPKAKSQKRATASERRQHHAEILHVLKDCILKVYILDR